MARHAEILSRDVPQRDVDSGHRRRADYAGTVPEVLPEHHLPKVLDAAGVLTHEGGPQILHGADDGPRVPLERRVAPTDEPGLIGFDLDENPVAHPGVANEGFDCGNIHGLLIRLKRYAVVEDPPRPGAGME